jgi:peptide/nickel transport system substrate-binding protein
MMMKRFLTVLLVCMLMFTLVLSGCGARKEEPKPAPAPAPAPAKVRDTVIIALQGEPTTLDPQFPDDGNMRAVTDNVFERLLEFDGKTLQPKPGLATDIKKINDTTWELTIRDGVKFHNGDYFTAEDAVFSIKRIIDPAYKSQQVSYFSTIKDAKVVAPNKIQVTTDGFDALFPKRMARLDMVSKKYVEANKDKVNTQPVGTGPYKVIAWNRGVDIQATAFDGYWGKKPAIKNVKYRFIQEGSTRLAALKAGEIDFAVNMLPEYMKDIPNVKMETSAETYWIRFNQLRGPMVKKEMRLAANYAIDRKALAEALFLGAASPAQGQMGKEGYFGYSSKVKAHPYDKEKAKELLKKAGYNGEVIELVSERGRWLKDGEVTEAVAAMLTDAGFNVKIKFLSWQEWLDTLFTQAKAPALQFSSNGNGFFDIGLMYNTIVHSKGSQSVMKNPEIDKKIEAARKEPDPAKRQAMYDELALYFYEDPFAIPLLNLKDIYGLAKDLEWTPRQDSMITVYEMSFKS